MKRTINANIGTVAFTIDEDAYQTLRSYYQDIRSRLCDSERQEVMDDVEARTADIFRDNLTYLSQVVSVDLVRMAMATLGSPESFGDERFDAQTEGEQYEEPRPHRLYRSRRDRMLGGVCGGLAEYFDMDSTLVRILMIVLLIMGSFGFWLYLILWIIIPTEPFSLHRERCKSRYTNTRERRQA